MRHVAICGGVPLYVSDYLRIGFERLGWHVSRIVNQQPPDQAWGAHLQVPFYPADSEREDGDIFWEEFTQHTKSTPFDLILIMEGAWSFLGAKRPQVYQDTPVALLAADPSRGPEKHIRDAVKSGADWIFVFASPYEAVYQSAEALTRAMAFYGGLKPQAPQSPAARFKAVHRFPFSYRDDIFKPDPTAEKHWDVLFFGSWVKRDETFGFETAYGESWHRSRLLELLRNDADIKSDIQPVSNPFNWAKAIHTARILIQIDGGVYPHLTGMTMRHFEVMGSGEFLLTNTGIDILKYFTPGFNLGTYDLLYHPLHHNFEVFDYTTFKETLMEWLGDDERREKVARAGYQEVRREHRPEDRARVIAETVGVAHA